MPDYLLHRPSAHALVLHTNKAGGFGTSGTGMGSQEHGQAGTVDRHAARHFPWQISSLKESREEGGQWLILAVSGGGHGLHYQPSPLLLSSILSPGARSLPPAHIHCSYRRIAPTFQRTWRGAEEGAFRAVGGRVDICGGVGAHWSRPLLTFGALKGCMPRGTGKYVFVTSCNHPLGGHWFKKEVEQEMSVSAH